MFGKKKVNSEEYEDLRKKIVSIVCDLDEIKSALAALRTNQNSLRGLVNRKMGEDSEIEDSENNKYSQFLN